MIGVVDAGTVATSFAAIAAIAAAAPRHIDRRPGNTADATITHESATKLVFTDLIGGASASAAATVRTAKAGLTIWRAIGDAMVILASLVGRASAIRRTGAAVLAVNRLADVVIVAYPLAGGTLTGHAIASLPGRASAASTAATVIAADFAVAIGCAGGRTIVRTVSGRFQQGGNAAH